MPRTIVRCTQSGCRAVAEAKVASAWRDGAFTELKTYGYACPDHATEVIAYAETRYKPPHLAPGETVGPITAYELSTK